MVKKTHGYTLVELLIVSAILALILSMGSTLLVRINTFMRVSVGKIETQRDVRNVMTLITQEIRRAKASQITLSRADATQPPYSKITFQNYLGETVSIWQSGRTLSLLKNGSTGILSKNLRSLIFSFPSTDDMTLLTILLTIEKSDGSGRTQSLQLGGETVRILND